MYAYDSLVSWKAALAETAPTLAAGLSLILFTALPINAKYEEDSYIYDEVIRIWHYKFYNTTISYNLNS